MKTFNTFGDLAEAKVLTGTPVSILEPGMVQGVVRTTGEGLSLLSGNVFVPNFENIELVAGRKISLLEDSFVDNLSTYVNSYIQEDSGAWVPSDDGLTSAIYYHGQLWNPIQEVVASTAGYLVRSWTITDGLLEVVTTDSEFIQFRKALEEIDLAWAARNEYVYEGIHAVGMVFRGYTSFSSTGKTPYFPAASVPVPYTSPQANPANDPNLVTIGYTEYKSIIDSIHRVGEPLFRFSGVSPKTDFPWQEWLLVSGDASIRLGDGSAQSTTPSGNNDPGVPLVAHEHNMDHDHPAGTTSGYSHNHKSGMPWFLEDNRLYMKYGYENTTGSGFDVGGFDNNRLRLPYTDTDVHNHTFDVPPYYGNTGNTGSPNPTLDVRGASIKLNLWIRTS